MSAPRVVSLSPDATPEDVNAFRLAFELGSAWAEAEDALPEGWHIAQLASDGPGNPGWYIDARSAMVGGDRIAASGPSPTAALQALAKNLRVFGR